MNGDIIYRRILFVLADFLFVLFHLNVWHRIKVNHFKIRFSKMKIDTRCIVICKYGFLSRSRITMYGTNNRCFISGEIRNVNNLEKRIYEAQKLGFKKAIVPKFSKKLNDKFDIEIVQVPRLMDAIAKCVSKK